MKMCPGCLENRDRSMFYREPCYPDGLSKHCRICSRAMQKARRDRMKRPVVPKEKEPEYSSLDTNPRFEIYKRDGYLCYYCGINVLELSATQATLDHIYPESLGGKSVASNLVTACKTCNCNKSYIVDIIAINEALEIVKKRNEAFNLNGSRVVGF